MFRRSNEELDKEIECKVLEFYKSQLRDYTKCLSNNKYEHTKCEKEWEIYERGYSFIRCLTYMAESRKPESLWDWFKQKKVHRCNDIIDTEKTLYEYLFE